MTTYNFDAFGNPVQTTATGKLPATVLSSDGVFDPALAPYYSSGRFISPDIHAGEATAPASLRRFDYADQTPIDAADPV